MKPLGMMPNPFADQRSPIAWWAKRIGLIIGCACVALYWTSFAASTYLRSKVREGATRRLVPLVGLKVPIDRYVDVSQLELTPESKVLVFVASDTCPFTRADLPIWRDILNGHHFASHDAAVFISLNGHNLIDDAREVASQNHLKNVSAVIPDAGINMFLRDTGIYGTPDIIELDAGLRLRFVTMRAGAFLNGEL
jgi:hypothetical protein